MQSSAEERHKENQKKEQEERKEEEAFFGRFKSYMEKQGWIPQLLCNNKSRGKEGKEGEKEVRRYRPDQGESENQVSKQADSSESETTIYQAAVQRANEAKAVNEPIFAEMLERSRI